MPTKLAKKDWPKKGSEAGVDLEKLRKQATEKAKEVGSGSIALWGFRALFGRSPDMARDCLLKM